MLKRLAVIGASGATGKHVIRLALKQGYLVTAVVRKPDAINPSENLTVVRGDVTSYDSLLKAFHNVDAVISCLGPANSLKAGDIMSTGAKNIVSAAEEVEVKRVVFMSGILQTDGKELSFWNRFSIGLIRLFYQQVYKDKVVAEALIRQSALPWVIVRASGLKEVVERGTYTAGPHAKIAPFKPLSYADCAACLVRAVEEPAWTRKIINVGL
jgi:uncharacterized protein YbjT (DUF2867 family)